MYRIRCRHTRSYLPIHMHSSIYFINRQKWLINYCLTFYGRYFLRFKLRTSEQWYRLLCIVRDFTVSITAGEHATPLGQFILFLSQPVVIISLYILCSWLSSSDYQSNQDLPHLRPVCFPETIKVIKQNKQLHF